MHKETRPLFILLFFFRTGPQLLLPSSTLPAFSLEGQRNVSTCLQKYFFVILLNGSIPPPFFEKLILTVSSPRTHRRRQRNSPTCCGGTAFFFFTIRPGRLSLPSVAYEFTSIPGRVQFLFFAPHLVAFTRIRASVSTPPWLDEESILANKHTPYTHLGAPLPAYPYKTRVGGSRSYEVPTTRSTLPKGKRCVCQVRFVLVGLGGFDQKCYAYAQDYPSSRKLRGDYFNGRPPVGGLLHKAPAEEKLYPSE